jgi:serine/threonine-protein kinase
VIGSSIGSIRIESQLGVGGMGEVYLGYDPRLDRRVAVKTIHRDKRLSPQIKARFLREARLLSKLGHPSICQVYDLIETPGADFLVLEYVQGTNLRNLAAREEIPFERKLQLAGKIATALAAAHREKIVHRDLKADNIMVTPEGEVKVLDFGIARSLSEPSVTLSLPPELPDPSTDEEETRGVETAQLWGPALRQAAADDSARLTRLGMVMGTLGAMSPEQLAGKEVTEASDLYSFGILLQELFTGAPAYEATGEAELAVQVSQARVRPIAGLDPDLTRLIQDLESLDPRRRPSAEASAERLRWILEKPQRQRRQRLRLAAVAASFAFLLVVLAVVSWLAVRAEQARREAERRRAQAESLIGFMLGDLRTRLEQVNRLDVLDAVGDRALAYFAAVPENQLTAAELTHRVEAILQIGEVRYTQGNLKAALAAFERAFQLSRNLVARDPAGTKSRHLLCDSQSWIGQIHFDQGRAAPAQAAWQETLRLASEQRRRHPGDATWARAVAAALHNLGTAYELRGDLESALRSYRESLEIQRRLAAPDADRGLMAATLAFVSQALERQGDLQGALAERRAYVRLQEENLADHPEDPSLRLELATARGFLANLLATLGEDEAALADLRRSFDEISRLAAEDPDNAVTRRWLGSIGSGLGVQEWIAGNTAEAVHRLEQARTDLEPLAAADPANPDFRLQLGVAHVRLAKVLEPTDPARARAEALAAASTLRPLHAGPPDAATLSMLAETEVTRGRIEARLGHSAEARQAWERALAVLEPASSGRDWSLLALQAEALLSLGRAEEARPILQRLDRIGYHSETLDRLLKRASP